MFITYDVSIELIRNLREIARHDRELADQLRRAASSITLNLAEGERSSDGNQRKHYTYAHGSANEVKAALDVAECWGWIDDTANVRAILDRLLALLWRLTHPRSASVGSGRPPRANG
jgi:four helix bundle protein